MSVEEKFSGMRMLTEKEARRIRREDNYARSVKNCAHDMFHFGEDATPIFLSSSRERTKKFIHDVAKELERLKLTGV